MAQSMAGWYSDPTGQYVYRFWNGAAWTNQVSNGGTSGIDPNPMDPSIVQTPPAPGSQAPAPSQPAPVPTVQVTQKSGGMGFGTILGVLIGILIVVVIVVVLIQSADDDTTDTTVAPTTTEAPTTTAAP
jgi:hypothetical protein